MTTTMNISGYEIEREEAATGGYDDEAMRVEWNSQLQVNELPAATEDRRTAFLPELVNVDVDAFLEKMDEYRH